MIFEIPDWKRNKVVYSGMIALVGLLMAILASGCASGGPRPGPVVADTLCGIARLEVGRCDRGEDTNRGRCDAARATAAVCAIGGHVRAEQGLLAGLSPGVGYVPRSLQTCWRERVSGPVKCGTGRLDVDPWTVAGMPGASQGGLPCDRPEINEAYRQAFGHPCRGDGAPLGGYVEVSNEVLRGAVVELEWACRNRPDLLQSEGAVAWDCRPSGLDMIRLAAFRGGGQVIAAIRAAMPQDSPPPAPRCGDGNKDPGETCVTCPADAGACPPPPTDSRLDCSTLELPPPGAPQFVARKVGVESTGLASYELLECRGGSLPTPEPARPEISAATRATLSAVCGWIRSDQPTRRRRCAAAVAEVFGIDALAAAVALDAGEAITGGPLIGPVAGALQRDDDAGRWVLQDRLAAARRGRPFYDNGKVACYQVSETEDFCEPSRKAGGVLADAAAFRCAQLQAEAAAAGDDPPACVGLP